MFALCFGASPQVKGGAEGHLDIVHHKWGVLAPRNKYKSKNTKKRQTDED